MNFSSMAYFLVLAEERNFTKAAERLHLTQQSLSGHIARMEKDLGCQLIIRHTPLELTYAGERLLSYAKDFDDKRRSMEREFYDISKEYKGLLRIGVAATRGQTIFPKVVEKFQETWPGISIEFTAASNEELCELLVKGKIDLAAADFPGNMAGLAFEDFYEEEIALVLSRDFLHKIYGEKAEETEKAFREGNFSALKDCPFVLGSDEDIDGRIGRNFLKKQGIKEMEVRALSHNVGFLLSLSIAGAGACFCP